MTLTGAYGRKYGSLRAALADWSDGKDFQVHHMGQTTYCSKRDFEEGELLQMRWGTNNEHAAGITLKKAVWI